ncbi:flagellar hook-length control protein FliK [Roseibium sp. HPY-6]|uniref:flagellar hook-length control protein FliK n=1 Tax=Roseibium sp. HPY-6 TaxID=3229852 RepID=UPI00338FD523
MVETVSAQPIPKSSTAASTTLRLEPGAQFPAKVEANLPGGIVRLATSDAKVELRVPAPLPTGADVTVTVTGNRQNIAVQIAVSQPSGKVGQDAALPAQAQAGTQAGTAAAGKDNASAPAARTSFSQVSTASSNVFQAAPLRAASVPVPAREAAIPQASTVPASVKGASPPAVQKASQEAASPATVRTTPQSGQVNGSQPAGPPSQRGSSVSPPTVNTLTQRPTASPALQATSVASFQSANPSVKPLPGQVSATPSSQSVQATQSAGTAAAPAATPATLPGTTPSASGLPGTAQSVPHVPTSEAGSHVAARATTTLPASVQGEALPGRVSGPTPTQTGSQPSSTASTPPASAGSTGHTPSATGAVTQAKAPEVASTVKPGAPAISQSTPGPPTLEKTVVQTGQGQPLVAGKTPGSPLADRAMTTTAGTTVAASPRIPLPMQPGNQPDQSSSPLKETVLQHSMKASDGLRSTSTQSYQPAASVRTQQASAQPAAGNAVNPSPAAQIAREVMQPLGEQQSGLGSLYAQIGSLMSAQSSGQVSLPDAVTKAMQQILGLRLNTSQNITGRDLQQAVRTSGQFREASLAAPQSPASSAPLDLKSALLSFKSLLKQLGTGEQLTRPAGQPAPPSRQDPPQAQSQQAGTGFWAGAAPRNLQSLMKETNAALARVRMTQLVNSGITADDRPQAASRPMDIVLELPLALGQETAVLQMQIGRDGNGQNESEDADPAWRLRFALDLTATGPLEAAVSLRGGGTFVSLWVERKETFNSLDAVRETIEASFADAGLDLQELRLVRGLPPRSAAQSGGLIDRQS